MRLYSLHKRQFVGVFIVFFIILFVILLIGLAGPTVIESKEYQPESPSKQLVKSSNVVFYSNFFFSKSGPYTLPIDYLDKFHQRLWLTMKPITDTTGKTQLKFVVNNFVFRFLF